jgi:hypothetical protein
MTASSALLEDGTASVVPPIQGRSPRLIVDFGSEDATIGSGSITSLLVVELWWASCQEGPAGDVPYSS